MRAFAQSRWRWVVALAAVTLGLVILLFPSDPAWEWLGVYPIHPPFADLVAILAAGQANHAGLDPYASPNPYDPLGRPHVYGPGWLITGYLGLRPSDALWLGPLVLLGFVITGALVLAPIRRSEAGIALLLLVSPPVLLAINRVNNDLFVFMALAAAAWLLMKPRLAYIGDLLIGGAAILKIYPAAAMVGIFFSARRRLENVTAGLMVAALVGIGFWLWRADFARILQIAPRPQTVFAYGAPVFTITWRALGDQHLMYVAGLVGGSVAAITVLWRHREAIWRSVPLGGASSACFVAGASCWLFCFLANSNYAYRFVLVLLPARLWLETARNSPTYMAGRMQLFLWLFIAWLGVPKNWWAVAAKEKPISAMAWTWFNTILGIEQSVVTWLTIALALALVGATVRRMKLDNRTFDPPSPI